MAVENLGTIGFKIADNFLKGFEPILKISNGHFLNFLTKSQTFLKVK
jgi:hypothetical protein